VGDPRREWEQELVSRLSAGARVLELGCGAGVPDTQRLAARFQVTGVHISAEQVRRARAAVPDAAFIHADFTAVELESESFDAVVSFYAFNHVPRELLAPLFARIHRWLVPCGLLMTALGAGDTEAWTGEWLGAPTFFSSFPPHVNTRLVTEAGFEIIRDELVGPHRDPVLICDRSTGEAEWRIGSAAIDTRTAHEWAAASVRRRGNNGNARRSLAFAQAFGRRQIPRNQAL
jgi:cyclopropane fatty-acyl-phospholipid synthase-like methyltransferase